MSETISVIIAVYNAEKYIETCIKSIFNSTFKHIEIIAVNDGSTDNSSKMLHLMSESFKNLIVIDKENGGCYSAWNRGLDEATGQYIGFVDNDDVINPYMYELLYKNLIENNADISTCGRYRNENTDLHSFMEKPKTMDLMVLSGKEACNHLLTDTSKIKPAVWDKLYKRTIFDNTRFPDTFFEDAALTYKLLYSAKKVVVTDTKLYAYSIHPGSMITSKWDNRKLESYYFIISNAKSFFKGMNEEELYNASLYWSIQFALSAWINMRKSRAFGKDEYIQLNEYVKNDFKELSLIRLGFNKYKLVKKYVEFFLFVYCPTLFETVKR